MQNNRITIPDSPRRNANTGNRARRSLSQALLGALGGNGSRRVPSQFDQRPQHVHDRLKQEAALRRAQKNARRARCIENSVHCQYPDHASRRLMQKQISA